MAVTEVVKRNGKTVPYDPARIEDAVIRCLTNGCGWQRQDAQPVGEGIANRITNVLDRDFTQVAVEELQRRVVDELWAQSFKEEAAAYLTYAKDHAGKRLLRPITADEEDYINRTKLYFRKPYQIFNFLTKYARFREDLGRRETWEECVDRTITFLQGVVARQYPDGVETVSQTGKVFTANPLPPEHPLWDSLRQGILNQDAMPAMRMLQMAGPSAERCNVGIFNCSFGPVDDLQSIAETLYILMQGSGAGYTVEAIHVDKLPRIKRQTGKLHHYQIPDSTIGWCDALLFGLERWFEGEDVQFDFSLIRPAGAPLKTKGGRASGPGPLQELLAFCRKLILAKQGKVLSCGDVLRMMCVTGKIVQVGGVRRASEIALTDLEDDEIRRIKRGAYWERGESYLSEANISAVYDEKPDALAFLREWTALIESGTGERGIFNRGSLLAQLPVRRIQRLCEYFHCTPEELLVLIGTNPCGEILLILRAFCNLSITLILPTDSVEEIKRKLTLAAQLGTLQSLCTQYQYLRPEWQEQAELERLLGVDIMGDLDHPLLRPWTQEQKRWDPEGFRIHEDRRALLLQELKAHVVRVNAELAAELGIYQSTATTCRKPAGNSEWTLDRRSLKLAEAPYQIRRFRNGALDPVSQLLKDEGVPCQPENGEDPHNPRTLVFSFPVANPSGCLVKGDLSAVEQLENWLVWKKNWCEHNPSVTITVKDDEWIAVGHWILENWDWVGGISFLPEDNGVYQQVPNEGITREQYEKLAAEFPDVNWAKLVQYESDDEHVNVQREAACTAGGCSI